MKFTFERFTAAGKRYSPTISVRSNGALGISQGALHQAKMTEGTWHVVLFYDRANKALAVKPTQDPDEEGVIKLSVRKLDRDGEDSALSAFVAAKSFFNFYGIPHTKTTSYKAEWDEQQKMLISVLHKPDYSSATSDPDENSTILSTPDKSEPTVMAP